MKRLILLALLFTIFFIPLPFKGQEIEEGNLLTDGTIVVYPISFPFSYTEYEFINYTLVENEVPMRVYNPLIISLAVWNTSKENPLYLAVDNRVYRITREGLFTYMFNLTLGIHNLVLYTDVAILTHALIDVIEFRQQYITISILDYKARVSRAAFNAFIETLIGALAGVALGIFIKKQLTLVTNYIILAALFAIVILYGLTGHYFFIGLALVSGVAYAIVPEKTDTIIVAKIDRENPDHEGELLFINVIKDTNYIPDRYLNGLRGKHKRLERKAVRPIYLSGIEFIVAKEYIEEDNKAIIYGDPYLAEAFIDANVVEKYSSKLIDALTENVEWKKMFPIKIKEQSSKLFWSFITDYFSYLTKSGLIEKKQVPEKIRKILEEKEKLEEEPDLEDL